jgi:hypothetical protein
MNTGLQDAWNWDGSSPSSRAASLTRGFSTRTTPNAGQSAASSFVTQTDCSPPSLVRCRGDRSPLGPGGSLHRVLCRAFLVRHGSAGQRSRSCLNSVSGIATVRLSQRVTLHSAAARTQATAFQMPKFVSTVG